jgi:hypothetical protein
MKTFKVGQKVRWDGECDGIKGKGRIFTVDSVLSYGRIREIYLGESMVDGYGRKKEGKLGYYWYVCEHDSEFTVVEEKSGCWFEVGDKVKIISKSIGVFLKDSDVYNDKTSQEKGYWIVEKIIGNSSGTDYDNCICVGRVSGRDKNGGDFFAPIDLELVIEKQNDCLVNTSNIIGIMNSLIQEKPRYYNFPTVAIPNVSSKYLLEPLYYYSLKTFNQKPVEKTKNNKLMSVIKNIFKSEERKALEHFGVVNGDGKLTDTGRAEFVDYLYEKMNTEREAFVALLIEEHKKVTK